MAYTAEKTNSPKLDRKALEARIQGWGADLDLALRPAVPKEKAPPSGTGAHWIFPERQTPRYERERSTEHKFLTPVFGTVCPPRGLSGVIRKFAYKYSEGRMAHWLILLFADRVDVAESFVRELFFGRPGNVFSEMGLSAEWKRHGLRSRMGQHRSDVTSRFPKELLLVAGLTLTALQLARLVRNREKERYRYFSDAA
ncbi:MAG: hypothetical protein AB1540_02605 [Bdellovibrionota bacterium]